MPTIAKIFAFLLIGLGPILYFNSEPDKQSVTAFIPSFFGVALLTLGFVAGIEKARMHAMHGAALVGLLGFVLPLGRVIYAATQPTFQFGLAAGGSLAMAGLCAIFLGLCVKSFVDARAARKMKEAQEQKAP
jgi:uncharacterized membrane protein